MRRRRPSIADLLSQGPLERIAADCDEAREILSTAEKHLLSAERLLSDDPAGAYQLLYDAARKATSADMLANGYRAKSDRPGAHAAVVLYAEEALRTSGDPEALQNFDRMRRSRNRTEYGPLAVGRAQVETDLGHARSIVRAVSTRLQADEEPSTPSG
jgi:hypothetical protein